MTERQPWTPDDFWSMRFVTELRLSPDGRALAYTVETNDREANETRSAVWLYDRQTGEMRQLTSGLKRDGSPRWSPDGTRLAFVSTRAGKQAQLYVMPVAGGGEARRLTSMRHGASDPFWSADGSWVGFESEVRPDESPSAPEHEDAPAREKREKEESERLRVITRLQYRWDGKGYLEGRTHLFRAALAGGAVEPLTEGDYDNSDAACSPDGRYLAFASDRSDERDANMTSDIWLLDLQTRALRRLTDGTRGAGHPAWSPDGKRLAFISEHAIHGHSVYNVPVLMADVETGEITNPLEGQDLSAEPGIYGDIPSPSATATLPTWSRDGQHVYFLNQRLGGVDVLRVPAEGGAAETVVDGAEWDIRQVALTPDGQHLYALQCGPTEPWDIWEYDLRELPARAGRRVTEVNRELLAARPMTAPERFTLNSFDGWEIEAWLYRPESATNPAPLVLWIHGGPHGAYGQTFYLQAQLLASRGYAVLHANPRGSTGYGEDFAQACDHDWGGGDYKDLMAAVDAALARGGLDADRLAVMGTSYGGYMTNWIVGQTDRFKAGVTINSVTNLFTSFGTGDIDSVWAEGDYGWPWEHEAFYKERSPITYASRMTTPLRIIGAEDDYRCPISQSEELYTWLKKLGRAPVDFVRVPHASHSAYASPRQRVRRIELALEWIERYCPAG